MAKLLGLCFIGKSLFFALQEKVLFPVVAQAWIMNQASVIDVLHQVGSVDLCGDCRCDSPGHFAKYGSLVQIAEVSQMQWKQRDTEGHWTVCWRMTCRCGV